MLWHRFIIQSKPNDAQKFVDVIWKTSGIHHHENIKQQIRGAERKILSGLMILDNDGYSKKIRFAMLAYVEDDENTPSEEILPQVKH